jgi:hypothetical protein
MEHDVNYEHGVRTYPMITRSRVIYSTRGKEFLESFVGS